MKFKELKKYFLPLLILVGISNVCCKKFVQVDDPSTQLATVGVFDNTSTATAALTSIYSQMYNNEESFDMAQNLGLLSDELTNYSTSLTKVEFYTNAMVAASSNGVWVNAYNYIYQANAIIAALQNNSTISPVIAQQLTGEALFIRAFWHFYLTNEYGDVPLVTTTLYTVNEKMSRTPQVQVYAQVIQDLRNAESLLNTNYVDATDTIVTVERTRPTKAAAEALLARAYLYRQQFDSAEIYSSMVINNPLYSLCTNLSSLTSQPNAGANSVFMMNSTESIWQLATPLPTSYNTEDAQFFVLTGAPSTQVANSNSISSQLLSSFEAGDLRKSNWIDSIVEGGTPYYFPFKYQQYNTATIVEYTMVLRLAEQYLIRAEAEANLQDMADAASDLNKIRSRAGLGASPTLTASSTLVQADSAILHERQVELFAEWGNRWFDLIRMNIVNAVMGSPGNVCQFKGGTWVSSSALFPIPQSEISDDPNLSQNQGY